MWYRVVLVSVFLAATVSSQGTVPTAYYWREYVGAIPDDAIVAGKKANGDSVYIGQAYVKDKGLFPVQITKETSEVFAAIDGATRSKYAKILCGEVPGDFVWVPATASSLQQDLANKKPVIGGHRDDVKNGVLYIGKIEYDGGAQVGKVDAFTEGNAGFWWVVKDNSKEEERKSYEVLTYKEKGKSA